MTQTGTRNIARGKNMVSSRIQLVSHLKAPVWTGRSWPDRLLASELRTLLDFWGRRDGSCFLWNWITASHPAGVKIKFYHNFAVLHVIFLHNIFPFVCFGDKGPAWWVVFRKLQLRGCYAFLASVGFGRLALLTSSSFFLLLRWQRRRPPQRLWRRKQGSDYAPCPAATCRTCSLIRSLLACQRVLHCWYC